MKSRVVIVGGGASGLICSYVFSHYRDVETVVIEPGKPGGEFLAGGLRYVHRTDEMVGMLTDLNVVFTTYTVQGGILLHGKVEPYPRCLRSLSKERAARIQQDHYRKTRRTEPGQFASKAMNDPESVGPRRALRCDFRRAIRELAFRTRLVNERLVRVEQGAIQASQVRIPYDYLVLTIPLWVIKRVVSFSVPDAMAVRLNVVNIEPHADKYVKWDYVYTPYTPDDLIHRISPKDGEYSCEFNGDWGEDENRKLHSDLNYLFPDGWALADVKRGLKGHLLPLSDQPEWPANVRPLGRFAQWNPRATLDVVINEAHKIAEGWGWNRIG